MLKCLYPTQLWIPRGCEFSMFLLQYEHDCHSITHKTRACHVPSCYFASKRDAKYCDGCVRFVFVCLSAWLFVCSYISKTAWRIFNIYYEYYVWLWFGPPPVALRYVMYFRFCGWRTTTCPMVRRAYSEASRAWQPKQILLNIKISKHTPWRVMRRGQSLPCTIALLWIECSSGNTGAFNSCHDNNAVAKYVDNQSSCHDDYSVSNHFNNHYET